ncbi:MAG: hypothetical protein BJ554DRAFT_7596, partial [Olpidium bornovanus]
GCDFDQGGAPYQPGRKGKVAATTSGRAGKLEAGTTADVVGMVQCRAPVPARGHREFQWHPDVLARATKTGIGELIQNTMSALGGLCGICNLQENRVLSIGQRLPSPGFSCCHPR